MKNDEKLKKIREALLTVMREQRRWLLLVGTGPSVDMDPELGMSALAGHLLDAILENTDDWATIAEKLSKGINGHSKNSAKHYGFTKEEFDFIINYDIKYRMGKELGT